MKTKLTKLNLIFLIIAGIVTLAGIFWIWNACGEPFKVSSVSEIKACNYDNYLNKKGVNVDGKKEYYIYVYDENDEKAAWYEGIVTEYANYARLHSSALPIYRYKISGDDDDIIGDLGSSVTAEDDLPGIVLIADNALSTKYLTYTKINNLLTDAMNK